MVKEVYHHPDNARQLAATAELLGVGLPAAPIGRIHHEIHPHVKEQSQDGLDSFLLHSAEQLYRDSIGVAEARDTLAVFRHLLIHLVGKLMYMAQLLFRDTSFVPISLLVR